MSQFSETDFSKIYLIHLKLFCYFNPFKGTLARNRLKSLILTTSKILRSIYCVSNILNSNTQVDQSAFFKDSFFDDFSKNSFAIVYFCTMKLLDIASLTIKKA